MRHTTRTVAFVFLLLLGGFSQSIAEAGLTLTYGFRPVGSEAVIATMTFESPPASLDTKWSTTDSSTLVSILLHDPTRGDLQFAPGSLGAFPLSSDGPTLTGGSVFAQIPEIGLPGGKIVFTTDLSAFPGVDRLFVSVASPMGGPTLVDAFGDWTAVPEPATIASAGLGVLLGLGTLWRRHRRVGRARVA